MKGLSKYILEKINPKNEWDTRDDFYRKGSIGNYIWGMMYKVQKTGDPNIASEIVVFLQDKFKNVEFSVTTPNTGKIVIKAYKKGHTLNDEPIAILDGFDKHEIIFSKIQEFLDSINK